jgi:TANFOR domain-containing protein
MYSHFKSNQTNRDRNISCLLRVFFISLGIFPAIYSIGQDVLKITTTLTPPYPTKIYQITDQPNKVSVMIKNNTGSVQNFYLRGSLNMESGGKVYTDPAKKGPKITLGAYQTMKLTQDNVQKAFNSNDLIWSGLNKDKVVRDGLPEDDYFFCFTAYDYATGQLLSSADQGGCSNPWPIRFVDPPEILVPTIADTVWCPTIPCPNNYAIFSWTRPPNAPATSQYVLEIVDPKKEITFVNGGVSEISYFTIMKSDESNQLNGTTIDSAFSCDRSGHEFIIIKTSDHKEFELAKMYHNAEKSELSAQKINPD